MNVFTMSQPVSRRVARFQQATELVFKFFNESPYARVADHANHADFAIGNPHDMPLPGFVNAIQRWSVPQNPDWFAYKMNEEPARKAVVAILPDWRKVEFETEDIFQ